MSWKKSRDPRIKKRGDTYYARFSKRGVRVEASLQTTNFDIAVQLTNKIESAILNGDVWETVIKGEEKIARELVEDLWPKFLEDKASGNSKHNISKVRDTTLNYYIQYYERYFKDFFGLKALDEINADLWESYIEFARAKSNKKGKLKIFNHAKYFTAFMSWAVKVGKLDKRPNIFNPDSNTFADEDGEVDGVGKNYSDEELTTLREGSMYNEKFHLWIIMAQYMGMRSTEVTQLQKDRIDFKANLIRLKSVDTKTKQKRSVPIHPEVLQVLKSVFESSDSAYLFPNRVDKDRAMDRTGFKKPWNELREQTGIEGRYHDFRHSYASRVFANVSINPSLAAKALGMSMTVAEKIYIHFTDEQLNIVSNNFRLESL